MGPHGGERLVFANLFDDRESDIGRGGAGAWPAAPADGAPAPKATRELWWWLYLLALVFLVVEWLYWSRRAGARLAARQRRAQPTGGGRPAEGRTPWDPETRS